MKWTVIAVVLLVVLAGCSAGQDTTTDDGQPSSPGIDETMSATPSPTASPIPTPTFTPTPIPNPWRSDTAVVSINKTADPDRNYAGLVQASINYWDDDGAEHRHYDVRLVVQPNASDADIEVRFVDSIDVCGRIYDHDGRFAGCAPILSANSNPDKPAVIYVLAGLTREDTVHTLNHEFGHLFGIDHDEEPMPLMNESYNHTFISKPDVDERAFPWEQTHFSVYIEHVDGESDARQESTREQVTHAMDYYASDADGWMAENITYEFVSDPAEADIRIEFTDDSLESDGSLGRFWGHDIDTDDELEYYRYVNISVNGIPVNRRGWHVGYWLGFAFGAESVDELPPPFDNPESDPRRHWW